MSSTSGMRGNFPINVALVALAMLLTGILLSGVFHSSSEEQPAGRQAEYAAQLNTLDTPALLALRRTEPVCCEILNREHVPLPVLQDCLLCLARRYRTTDLRTILIRVEQLNDESPAAALTNLCMLLIRPSPDKLEQMRDGQLEHVAAGLISHIAEIPRAERASTRANVAFALAERLSRRLPVEKRARFDKRIADLSP